MKGAAFESRIHGGGRKFMLVVSVWIRGREGRSDRSRLGEGDGGGGGGGGGGEAQERKCRDFGEETPDGC